MAGVSVTSGSEAEGEAWNKVPKRFRVVSNCATVMAGLGLAAALLSLVGGTAGGGEGWYTLFLLYSLLTVPYIVVGVLLGIADEPCAGDDVDTWHRALDLAVGVLVGAPITFALAAILPNGTELAESVEEQLVSLAVVGSLFTALVPLRSALHEATGHRRRRPRQDAERVSE